MNDDLTWIKGSHSFRFGWEGRWYYYNSGSEWNTGTYNFNNESVALPGYRTSTGFSYASFLLGEARSTGLGIPAVTTGTRSRTYGVYFQDDWKVRSNLTINMGIRWDIPTALTEVRQRQSGLDATLANPGADGLSRSPDIPWDLRGLHGKGRFADPYYKQFFAAPSDSPGLRRGAATRWSSAAGYGINYAPPIQDGWNYSYGTGFNRQQPDSGLQQRPVHGGSEL